MIYINSNWLSIRYEEYLMECEADEIKPMTWEEFLDGYDDEDD